MKTALKTASTATRRVAKAISTTLRRWAAWHKMRCVEIALHDAYTNLEWIDDMEVRGVALANITLLSRELCRTRAEYQAFLQPGERIVWDFS